MSKKYKKRRIRLLSTIVLILLAIFLYKIFAYTYRIYNLKSLKNDLNTQYTELRKQEDDLKIEIERLQNDEYLARYVREKYKYSKDGEIVLSVDETEEVIDEIDSEIVKSKTVITVSFTLLGILFIYIIFKKKR